MHGESLRLRGMRVRQCSAVQDGHVSAVVDFLQVRCVSIDCVYTTLINIYEHNTNTNRCFDLIAFES